MWRALALQTTFALCATGLAPAVSVDADELPFEPIFDGKTLDGWLSYTTDEAPENWGVEDGALVRLGGGGDVMTAAQYDNFELKLEWKISRVRSRISKRT